jgi:hypothetical protein
MFGTHRWAVKGEEATALKDAVDDREGEIIIMKHAASASLAGFLEDGDLSTVPNLLSENRDAYIVNRERGLIQLVGCRGAIVAQYPLSESLITALETSERLGGK